MSVNLTNDDRCVVDLLLDRPTDYAGPSIVPCFTTAPSANLEARLAKVETLLNTLAAYAAPEPSGDLLARTLARCEVIDVMSNTSPTLSDPVGSRLNA